MRLRRTNSRLFRELTTKANTKLVAKEIIQNILITDSGKEERIKDKVKDFSERIFADESIGISRNCSGGSTTEAQI